MEKLINSTGDQTQNWKAPGPDGIYNFLLKKLSAVHNLLVKCYDNFLEQPNDIPIYLTQGITYLLPKDHNTHDSSE